MTAVADPLDDVPKKKSKGPILLGFMLALAGAAGGYFAVQSGTILPVESNGADVEGSHGDPEKYADGATNLLESMDGVAFIPLEPLVVSIQDASRSRFLKFAAQLEVPKGRKEDVEAVMPRIVDVLNGYLRAVDLEQLSDPNVLFGLRAQLLRRIQVVTGKDHVRDLLIMEFVLN